MTEGICLVAGEHLTAQPVDSYIHEAEAGDVLHLFLPVEGHGLVRLAALRIDKVARLDKHAARTTSGVYKNVIFDTSPVAGKVYKNSENRRK